MQIPLYQTPNGLVKNKNNEKGCKMVNHNSDGNISGLAI